MMMMKNYYQPQPEDSFFSRGWIYASFDSILLFILTGMVAVFYERGKETAFTHGITTWGITPTPCQINEEKCLPAIQYNNKNKSSCSFLEGNHGMNSLCNLIGESVLYEREGVNLFSVIGIPFLLLSSQVISAAFSLLYIHEDSLHNTHKSASNTQKSLKKIALLMLTVYATCFLFIQSSWKIPGNNLFLAELFMHVSLFLISMISSSTYSEQARRHIMPMRMGELSLTIPILTVPVLAIGGNTAINEITITFFAVLFTNAFLLLLELDKNSNSTVQWRLEGAQVVVLMNAWLCLIPFLIHCALTISRLQDDFGRPWVLLSLVTLVLYELLYVLVITIYNALVYSQRGKRIIEYLLFSATTTNPDHHSTPDYHIVYVVMNNILDVLGIICKACIFMCIMGGALSLS